MSDPVRIVVIAGPTAVGKTEFAIRAAKRFDGEIVSCDSMQLYRYMDIGSAKPDLSQRAEVPHHLVDCIDPREPFSAAVYADLAKAAIADIASRGRLPVICGGTGLYLNGILYDMDFSYAPVDESFRRELEEIARTKGSSHLHRMLLEIDQEAAERIHPNNTKKIIRALERLHCGEEKLLPFSDVSGKNPDIDPLMIGLTRDRSELYERIDRRVDQLIERGLVEEVRGLAEMGLNAGHISMLGIGYKEILSYLNGESTLDEAIEKTKKNTRHLAKRQLTWFRRYDTMFWLNISEFDSESAAEEEMLAWLAQRL